MNEIIYPPGCKDIQVELANDELIRRLKKIQQAFQNIDQSAPERYKGLALYLGCDLFLQHEHEDVQLLVACCLADIFRIYAPDSPFEDPVNLKNIFIFLANQLKGLKDNSNPSFKRYFYLLENLECVKTFQLCTELDESQEIIATLFESAFKIVNEKTTTKVKSLLFELLCPLLNESDQISSRVLDTLFARIIEPQKSNNKEAYTLAVNLLKRGNQHFEFLVQNHLNNILLTSRNNMGNNLTIGSGVANISVHSNSSNDSSFVLNSSNVDAAEHSGVTGSANQFISDKLCLIIYELNTIRYAFLELLMPQLEYKLKSSDLKERREYTKLLSKMFSEKDSKLAKQLPQLWEAYLERFADMNEDIRKICVQHICEFLVQLSSAIKPITSASTAANSAPAVSGHQPGSPSSAASTPHHILEQIVEQIKNRALDAEEAIRYEVVQEILKAIKLDSNLITIDLLNVLKERTLDIKIRVRKLALQGLAALYKKIHSKVYGRQTVQIVSWIPSKIMKIYYQDSTEDKLLVERLLNTSIVPYTLGPREKMAQLYYAYCTFDDYSILSLVEIMKNRVLLYQLMRSIIEAIEAPNKTPEIEAKLGRDVMLISANLLDTAKGNEFMKTFVGLLRTNLNLKKYFKNFISLSCSSATAMQLLPTILQNMSSLNPGQMTMGRRLIERMSSLIIDKECLQALLELVEYKIKQKLTLKQRRMLSRKKAAGRKKAGGRGRRRAADSDYDEDGSGSDENDLDDEDESDLEEEEDDLDELVENEEAEDEDEENEKDGGDSDDDADSETRENAEIVKTLVKHIDDDGQKGLALVNMILSIHGSYGFNNLGTYEKLFTFTNSRKDHVVSTALKILGTYFACPRSADDAPVAMATTSHTRHMDDPSEKVEFDRINNQYLNKLKNFSVHGKPKQAKYSLYCIHNNFSPSSGEEVLKELRHDVQKEIQAKTTKTLITSLVSLGHICFLVPHLVGKELKDFISKTVVKELIMLPVANDHRQQTNNTSTTGHNNTTLTAAKRKANLKLAGKWCENEEELPLSTRSRIEAIKLVVRWCLGLKSECDSIIPTLKILIKTLKDNSDQPKAIAAASDSTVAASSEVSAAERARIRSICGNQLLKLGQEKSFKALITTEFFHNIARLIIDPVTNVRDIFVKKLKKGLVSSRLPFFYMAMFALCGYDTSRERKMRAKKIFSQLVKNMRQIDAKQQLARQKQQQAGQQPQPRIIPEMCLSYAISLLAHNIKIESVKDDLKVKQVKECVVIVLDPLLENPDGYQIAYIKNLLGKIKTVDDGLAAATALQARTSSSQQYPAAAQQLYQINKNLCTICEIFLFHMHSKSASSFTNKEFKFDVRLPIGFFTPKEQLNGAEAEQQQRLNEELQKSSQSELREVLGSDHHDDDASSGKPDDDDAASAADKDNKENTNGGGQRKRPTTSKIEIIARKRKSAEDDESTASTPAVPAGGGRQAKNAKASKVKSPLSSSTSSKQNDSNVVESEDEEDVPLGSLIGRTKNSPSPSPAAPAKNARKGAKTAAEPSRARSATPPTAPPNKRNKKAAEEEEEAVVEPGRKSTRKKASPVISPNTSVSSTASSAKANGKQAKQTPARGQKKKNESESDENDENDENESTQAKTRRSIRGSTTTLKQKPLPEPVREPEPKKVEEPTSQRPRRAAASAKK